MDPVANLIESMPQARAVYQAAAENQAEIYLVGGAVRDLLLAPADKPFGAGSVKDLDFAVVGPKAVALARSVADKLGGHYVLLDEAFDCARVVLDARDEDNLSAMVLDFAGCQGKDIGADLERRDFTINAIAYDRKEGLILDPTGGIGDLKKACIRMVSEANLVEDPLRVLRAYRFACLLGFEIEAETAQALGRTVSRLEGIARERINYELFTLLDCPDVGRFVHQMGELGLFETIFDELRDTRRVTANSYHHLPLFTHSLETIPQLEARLGEMPDWAQETLREEISPGITRLAATKIAAILHDIGKPETWQITEEGRHTFIGHDKVGANMIKDLSDRQKWPRAVSRLVERLVLWHLRPGALFHTGDPTPKALNRFYRMVGDELPALMLLSYGDLGATRGPGLTGPQRERLERNLIELLSGYAVFKEESRKMPKLLSGADVMRLCGIGPGPLIGQILNALGEAQSLKEVSNLSQAEAFALSFKPE
jgi:putative nucleotidyltransferase with HDIG domain